MSPDLHAIVLAAGAILTSVACDEQPSRTPPPSAAPPAKPAPVPATASTRGPPANETRDANTERLWTFDDLGADTEPSNFSLARTGRGRPGRWIVRTVRGAPSGDHVLAQLDDDATSFRFPVAVAPDLSFRDGRVGVRCKMISGRVDQACGLVARYRGESDYFVTRANALEDNIRLYTVHGGKRMQLASWSGSITRDEWHEYRFELRGDHLTVFWDGEKVLDHHDATFMNAGRVGLWTKADSVTWFDDLRAEPL